MRDAKALIALLASALIISFLAMPSALATPSVANAQSEVDRLRTEAATKFEAANVANLRIKELRRETAAIEAANLQVKRDMASSSKVLAQIAIANYKKGSLGQSMDLLLSADPKQFLADAAMIEVISEKYSRELIRYKILVQKNQASQFVISDKVTALEREKTILNREVTAAKLALQKAEKVLKSLKSTERIQLERNEARRELQILNESRKYASTYNADGSKGSVALKYALDKIGDIYVWGGAGPTKWDCSGLTMRSFQRAGISLPHSAAMQFRYGRAISYENVKPGDLLFFGTPISHVSIYMGKGKMVQAPRPGKKVEVVSLTKRFGYKPFVGAKRL